MFANWNFIGQRSRDATSTSGNAPGSLNGIIDANIIWRAFTVHLMFHEHTKWILYAGAVTSVLLQSFMPHVSKVSKIESEVYGYGKCREIFFDFSLDFPRLLCTNFFSV